MSIVPYHTRGREIVLRHHNAVVVRDPSSRRLELDRALTECPTCHQPLRSSSPDRAYDASSDSDSYVDPDYFRMLRDRQDLFSPDHPPSSPIRRLVQPFHHHDSLSHRVPEPEFISSAPAPAPQDGSRIRRTAFQPNYFQSFFVEERELGRGGKGVVLLVRHEIDGCHLGYFACKRVPVGDDHGWLEKVLLEVELLAKLSHPNLVSYRHVWLEDVQLSRFSPTVACAFILQQYCNGGDLWKKVVGKIPGEATKEELKAQMRRRSKGQLETPSNLWAAQSQLQPEDIYSFFRDITAGLAYLHAANYIHRDLKPSNCLLHTERGQTTCLISDFGEVQAENVARKSTGSTGTISYCAPEVLKRDATGRYGNFTTKSDIFSLGMILYFMCFGRLPYQAANTVHEELEDIDLLRAEITDWKGFEDERRERPELPGKLYTLLKQLLALNPNDRPSANEVLTALKNATILEGMFRGTIPPLGLGGRRVQDLDSPLPPSTPLPDPRKRANVRTASQEEVSTRRTDSSPSTITNSLQKLATPSTPRPSAPAMSPSSSQEGHYRDLSPSRRHPSPTRHSANGVIVPALLMPPPTTWLACWPNNFNVATGGGLVLAAAVDLSWTLEMWITGILLLLHFALVLLFRRQAQLCQASPERWDWSSAYDSA
ncbi:putative serine/threonine-protein kinase iks1 [Gnomoniopsis smithogilvyi]|uniref:non-specific serine/threonine protein kinase n=1 Tax=Gnomoniopsis smithogilvyi TaxID=1191159 RepID=A0A9W8Z494_9PEZI|nr:putative serine/threonine-protein kinase iks1 [Gnomoniopsis smithogilvyi]